jgi:O-glycosyl hydrolase
VADTTSIILDNTTAHQTVDGFGGTMPPLGDHLEPYRAPAIQAAFGAVGVSLGMLNVGIVETPADATDLWAQRGNDNTDPLTINAAGFNFRGSDLLRERVLSPASALGYTGLELGPLVSLTGPLDWLQPIRATSHQRYFDEVAEHVLAILQHWRGTYELTPRLVHLFNEPTSGNTELATSSTHEVVDLVKRVGDRLRGAGFASVKFVVPNEETIGRSLAVAQALLADPGARPYVGVIGFHTYPYGSVYSSPHRILETSGRGTPDPDTRHQLEQLKALGQQYNVPIWLTEVSEGVGNNDYSFDAIENVLARAIHIHDNFDYAGASAYFGMHTLWDSQTHGEHFAGRGIPFLSEQSSMVLVDIGTGEIKITGMGYAVGQYARWVKPGAVRIPATSGTPRVIVTAFRDQAGGRLVLVAVNNETMPRLLRIVPTGASPAGQITGEASYQGIRWGVIPPFSPTALGEVEYVAPARSVVTLVIPIH